tara:strand:- start:3236 stop:3385 length:150 start_codon:yes stop_codon:yes gene_type:complete
MSDWDLAVYKEALQGINKLIQDWRNNTEERDDDDYLYEIEGIVDEVGLE